MENKNEFSYNKDYTESTELHYDHLGTEISTSIYNKYDQYGNLTFKQYKDRGSIGSINVYEYQYDKEGNWTIKKNFYSEVEDGIIKEKKLITIEIREIEYYTENTQQPDYNLPEMPNIINDIRTSLPKIAKRKDAYLNEKKTGC